MLDIKLGVRPQQQPIPTSKISQDVLHQTEMIHQDVSKNAMQAYIKYKAYYDKMANYSKLKEADFEYVLQSKADHQGSKFHFQNFDGLTRRILKKYYQITIIWYAKLAITKRKCFIGWECVSSHPANHGLTY